MNRWMLVLFLGLACGLIACGKNDAAGAGQETAGAGLMHGPLPADVLPQAVELAPEHEVLGDPSHEEMKQTAPAEFDVLFHTTEGDFTVHVTRDWAPHGADRFYNLVASGFYDGTRFFRVVPGFVVQWGIHGEPAVTANWLASDDATIPDDEVTQSNTRGTLTFATSGEDSRTTQLFINFGNNARLDGMGFSVFGQVVGDGMEVVDALYDEYPVFDPRRDRDPTTKISQGHIMEQGNAYLDEYFPELDHIISATVVEPDGDDAPEEEGE